MIIDQHTLDALTTQAKASPRLRMNFDLRNSPTGREASIEDVVVSSGFRGRGIGRALMDHIIGFARRELAPLSLHLTSRPERVAANEIYGKLGFERRGTIVWKMTVKRPLMDDNIYYVYDYDTDLFQVLQGR